MAFHLRSLSDCLKHTYCFYDICFPDFSFEFFSVRWLCIIIIGLFMYIKTLGHTLWLCGCFADVIRATGCLVSAVVNTLASPMQPWFDPRHTVDTVVQVFLPHECKILLVFALFTQAPVYIIIWLGNRFVAIHSDKSSTLVLTSPTKSHVMIL